MVGRVCVITGASSGIGQAAAIELARRGASIILVCRNADRGEAALALVRAAATAGQPDLELADLASLSQVRDLAGRLSQRPAIDALINNAGFVAGKRTVTEDGYERTFAVNHLAPFLLTNLLLPRLPRAQTATGGPARIITVASAAHTTARLNLDDSQLASGYSPMRAYANSKLANILFTRELARRLDGTGVTANCLHPGVVRTRFGRSGGPIMSYGTALIGPFLRSPEKGAETVVYLASSQEAEGQTGGYYFDRRLREPSRAARDEATARRLWDFSAELTGLTA